MLKLKRNSSSRLLVGLDIEPGAIHAAEVAVNGHLVVRKAASTTLAPGVVRDGEVADAEALAHALKELFERHELNPHVRIGVANQRIVVRTLELPPISDAAELATAVRFQAAEQVPMPLDQAVLDHVSLGVVDTPAGPRQRVLLVAARRDMVDRLLDAVRAAGLRPEGVDLSAFAMLRALDRTETPVLHLAVAGMVNLAVASKDECLFTRVVPGGLEAMAVELAEREEIAIDTARSLLEDVNLSPERSAGETSASRAHDTAREASEVMQDGIRRIAAEVRNSLEFHHGADGADTTVERIVLTGAAAGISGFASTLSERLGLPVETGAPDAPGLPVPERLTVAAGLAVEEVKR